jgi:hypothetical protein
VRDLRRRGLVRIVDEEAARRFVLAIRPAIRLVVREETLSSLEAYGQANETADDDEDDAT